jgi:hypothetical protein
MTTKSYFCTFLQVITESVQEKRKSYDSGPNFMNCGLEGHHIISCRDTQLSVSPPREEIIFNAYKNGLK